MQIHGHSKGFLVAAVLSAATAALTVLGPTGPAAAAGAGRIGPGTQMVTAGHSCAANFVFRDARNRVYVGYAASCATTRIVPAAEACTARSLPLGTRVRFADRGRTVGYGTLQYSSLRALRRAGVTDAAACAANDFALVRVRGAARQRVAASVAYWGGPSSVGALPAAGSTVFGLLRPATRARTIPRVGEVASTTPAHAIVATALPSTRSARGSGFQDSNGRAVGILVASSRSGSNTVVSLLDAVTFAQAHGMAGLRVVRGHDAFTGSAIL
jgi:hypothetical protein